MEQPSHPVLVDHEDHDTQVLLRSVQDPELFSSLHRTYFPILTRYCLGLLAVRGFGWAQAEDLAEEILVKAFSARAQFEGRSRASTWFFSIAHHSCFNFLKRERSELLEDTHAGPENSVEGQMIQSELEVLLSSLMETLLTLEEREVFVLSEVEDLTYHEISSVIGCSIGKVHSLKTKALEKLKSGLTEKGFSAVE